MTPYLMGAATVLSTGLGGAFALRHRGRLPLLMGFAAGVLLGVVSFDILPEIVRQVQGGAASLTPAMTALVAGFLTLHVLEKLLLIHHTHEDQYSTHRHPQRGLLSALALVGHSFMDGAAIGLGFQAGPAVGMGVAVAVITHDFTDGMNTVTMMLSHRNTPSRAAALLAADAIAPLAGVLAARVAGVPAGFLTAYLGFLAGFLLYIVAGDILPEAHSEDSSPLTVALTVLGVLAAFAASRLV